MSGDSKNFWQNMTDAYHDFDYAKMMDDHKKFLESMAPWAWWDMDAMRNMQKSVLEKQLNILNGATEMIQTALDNLEHADKTAR